MVFFKEKKNEIDDAVYTELLYKLNLYEKKIQIYIIRDKENKNEIDLLKHNFKEEKQKYDQLSQLYIKLEEKYKNIVNENHILNIKKDNNEKLINQIKNNLLDIKKNVTNENTLYKDSLDKIKKLNIHILISYIIIIIFIIVLIITYKI